MPQASLVKGARAEAFSPLAADQLINAVYRVGVDAHQDILEAGKRIQTGGLAGDDHAEQDGRWFSPRILVHLGCESVWFLAEALERPRPRVGSCRGTRNPEAGLESSFIWVCEFHPVLCGPPRREDTEMIYRAPRSTSSSNIPAARSDARSVRSGSTRATSSRFIKAIRSAERNSSIAFSAIGAVDV